MTAIILAGGKSSRMGHDKAFIEIEGVSLIRRQLALLRNLFKKIIIVTNEPQRYRFKGIKIVKDIIAGRGPLGGIHAGLRASDSFHNFVMACDMPNLNSGLIRYVIQEKDNFDVVVPYVKRRYESLFAIYSKNCIMPIYNALISKDLKIRNFFKAVKVRIIEATEIRKFGNPDILFANINTPSDYDKALYSLG